MSAGKNLLVVSVLRVLLIRRGKIMKLLTLYEGQFSLLNVAVVCDAGGLIHLFRLHYQVPMYLA